MSKKISLRGNKEKEIIRNRVKCLNCNTILESKFRHDFQQCNCNNQTFVDGGKDYTRIGGIDTDLLEVEVRGFESHSPDQMVVLV